MRLFALAKLSTSELLTGTVYRVLELARDLLAIAFGFADFTIVAIAMRVCYSHSSLTLPPTFHFSHTLALIGSLWGPDIVWVIVLYCGYKTRKLLENMPLLALVTISVVIVSFILATQ